MFSDLSWDDRSKVDGAKEFALSAVRELQIERSHNLITIGVISKQNERMPSRRRRCFLIISFVQSFEFGEFSFGGF